jgi:hypothetical protein
MRTISIPETGIRQNSMMNEAFLARKATRNMIPEITIEIKISVRGTPEFLKKKMTMQNISESPTEKTSKYLYI